MGGSVQIEPYRSRLGKIREVLSKAQVDVFLINRPENIFYLSGFGGTTATLVVASDRAILVTDFRYVERAREEVLGIEVKGTKDITDGLINILTDLSIKSAAFESHFVSYDAYERLKENLSSIKLKPVSKEVEKLRQIKDSEEQTLMTKAAKISSAAFSRIVPFLKPGVTEKEIAIELLTFMHREGAEKEAFDVIVASGVRSAMPHAKTSEEKILKGDFVTVDLGVAYHGYYSDMTRTFVVGRASEKQRAIYELVSEAEALSLDSISPGKTGEEVDKICRDYLDKAGYGEYFLHGLGHGVGLEVHENPLIGPKGKETLQPGMVFTIEPGLYISGFGGVRIEDMVILKEEGIEVMTQFPKELMEI